MQWYVNGGVDDLQNDMDDSYKAYRKNSSISRTKSQNLNVFCLLLQWSFTNPLKPGVKLRMKM